MFSAATKSARVSTASGYQISRSLRFNSADNAYMFRSFGSTVSAISHSFSVWVKRSTLGLKTIASTYGGVDYISTVQFTASDTIRVFQRATNSFFSQTMVLDVATTSVFRDTAAWYHIAVFLDREAAVATDRAMIYVNGIRQPVSFTTNGYASLTSYPGFLAGSSSAVGARITATTPTLTEYFDGYIADIASASTYISPPQYTVNNYGQFDAVTGQWVPKDPMLAVATSYRGLNLKLADNSAATATTLGKDSSSNAFNFTPTNISVAAGAGNDSVIDVPTLYADGGNGRGNYCTLNPLTTVTTATPNNGALETQGTGSSAIGTIGVTSGKWYWEATFKGVAGQNAVGVYSTASSLFANNASLGPYGVRFDADSGTMEYTLDGTTWSASVTGLTSGPYFPYFSVGTGTGNGIIANFGQRAFSFTPPTGYKALNTFNLPEPAIVNPAEYFDTELYTGNATARTITTGFQPDLVWIKSRSVAGNNFLFDSVRGVQRALSSNTVTDESVLSGTVNAFASTGFTLGTNTNTNATSTTFASWNWKKGVTPGFDIVTYTGNGSGRTIAHGLGAAPGLMIVKAVTTPSTADTGWFVYHAGFATPKQTSLVLNTTAAQVGGNTFTWNDTAPTSSVFSIGNNTNMNINGATYVAYLWAEVPGFSRFRNYTGNNAANGPFIWCGFRPAFFLCKRTGNTNDWALFDNKRLGYNQIGVRLRPNLNNVEGAATVAQNLDFVSNGVKLRSAGGEGNLAENYVFVAFAENPFKYALAR